MFNDERINLISGKVYRNGVIIATIISIAYLILKCFVIYKQQFVFTSYIISEMFAVIGGIIIILIGELRLISQPKDERYYLDKYSFYITGAKYYLGIFLLGFAIAVPLEFDKLNIAMPLNTLLIHLEIIGLIYFSYFFKKNKIYFNYSVINENKSTYYKKVFYNIFKLLILLISLYSISLLIAFVKFATSDAILLVLLSILMAFIFSFITLGLIYFFISWVEKVSFDEEVVNRKFSYATLIVGIVTLLYVFVQGYLSAKNNFYIKSGQYSDELVRALFSRNLIIIKYVSYYYNAFYGLLMMYLLIQLPNKKTSNLGINIIVLQLIVNIIYDLFRSNIMAMIAANNDSHNALILFSQVTNMISIILSLVGLVGIFILMIGLIGEAKKKEGIILIPIAALIVNLFSFYVNQYQQSFINWSYFQFGLMVIINILYIITYVFVKNNSQVEYEL